jgi:hypothetical protein
VDYQSVGDLRALNGRAGGAVEQTGAPFSTLQAFTPWGAVNFHRSVYQTPRPGRHSMNKCSLRRYLALMALLPVAGCMQDVATYSLPEKDHGITLMRTRDWPWQRGLELEVIAIRLPECTGGITVKDVPREAVYDLYKAPDQYVEPIFILAFDKRDYAVSTQTCQVQEFKTPPADLGVKLGVFRVKDGRFQFVAAPAPGKG